MVEIIPKLVKRGFSWDKAVMYLAIGLLIASFGAMFFLNRSIAEAEGKMEELEQTLASKKTKEENDLEAEVLGYKNRIKNFAKILENHPYSSQIFGFVEGFCHPRVWFSEMVLNVDKNNLFLSGETTDFLYLEQQILVLRKEPLTENVVLSNLAVSESGTVKFNFDITFNPSILKPAEQDE